MPSNRLEKINELLRVEAGKIIQSEIELESGALVTVVRANASPTLEHATIWISIFPRIEEEKILKKINRKIYFLQQILNKRLQMRPVPKIRFDIDRSEERASHIEEIIKKVVK